MVSFLDSPTAEGHNVMILEIYEDVSLRVAVSMAVRQTNRLMINFFIKKTKCSIILSSTQGANF